MRLENAIIRLKLHVSCFTTFPLFQRALMLYLLFPIMNIEVYFCYSLLIFECKIPMTKSVCSKAELQHLFKFQQWKKFRQTQQQVQPVAIQDLSLVRSIFDVDILLRTTVCKANILEVEFLHGNLDTLSSTNALCLCLLPVTIRWIFVIKSLQSCSTAYCRNERLVAVLMLESFAIHAQF